MSRNMSGGVKNSEKLHYIILERSLITTANMFKIFSDILNMLNICITCNECVMTITGIVTKSIEMEDYDEDGSSQKDSADEFVSLPVKDPLEIKERSPIRFNEPNTLGNTANKVIESDPSKTMEETGENCTQQSSEGKGFIKVKDPAKLIDSEPKAKRLSLSKMSFRILPDSEVRYLDDIRNTLPNVDKLKAGTLVVLSNVSQHRDKSHEGPKAYIVNESDPFEDSRKRTMTRVEVEPAALSKLAVLAAKKR